MNSTKSIIILIGLCFSQISHAVEKGIIRSGGYVIRQQLMRGFAIQ